MDDEHGSWHFAVQLRSLDGQRQRIRQGGYADRGERHPPTYTGPAPIVATLDGSSTTDYTGTTALPAVNADDLPVWTHVAVVATLDQDTGLWTLELFLDGISDSTFSDATLQQGKSGTLLVIGRNTVDDVSVFGKVAALRFWNVPRTMAELRRTAFTGLMGNESGLLGCWPMVEISTGGPTGRFLPNIAVAIGSIWDADLQLFPSQTVGLAQDAFFLSTVASVAGLPAVKAHTMLPNDRWSHLAVVYRGGGALDLNPPLRFDAGQLDWVRCTASDALNPGEAFAIDAWIMVPSPPVQNATIIAQSYDQTP
ncbi:LamG-like jellyroll fold domain-containing protein [Nonomuraea basaltis]|uniref:LamG-like jellyroll fold domain-containing protein n=1 Tax=Nonomuraea basaltis TaxID=2495887 RepID=UPI0014862238|nr:LamG-like jellyroll fold domain-containing protein [Nonomuraea basaltis]